MLKCRDAARLASDELDRRLAWRNRLGLFLHVLMCATCRHHRSLLVAIHRTAGRLGTERSPVRGADAELSESARERLREEIRREK